MRKIYRVYSSSGDKMYIKASCPEEALEVFLEDIIEGYRELLYEVDLDFPEDFLQEVFFVESVDRTESYMFYYNGGWIKMELHDDIEFIEQD